MIYHPLPMPHLQEVLFQTSNTNHTKFEFILHHSKKQVTKNKVNSLTAPTPRQESFAILLEMSLEHAFRP
jgi:hypothetical protein